MPSTPVRPGLAEILALGVDLQVLLGGALDRPLGELAGLGRVVVAHFSPGLLDRLDRALAGTGDTEADLGGQLTLA